jgi:iron complex transport system permease protein
VGRGFFVWLILALFAGCAFAAHLLWGGVFSAGDIWSALLAGPGSETPAQVALWDIRLPRACCAMLVGANLACVGAAFQCLLRNPLADPYVLGVSSAAALGGAVATLLGVSTALAGLGGFLAAFVAALAGLAAVLLIGRAKGTLALGSVLIAGVAVGSFLWALVTFTLAISGQDSGKILGWLLGSFVSMDWGRTLWVAVFGGIGYFVLAVRSRALTVFSIGEESASRLGVEVENLKWGVLLAGTAMTAAAVSAVGIVGFVGLFTPHIGRRLFGLELRRLLPASALIGAAGVTIADLIAQKAVPGQEINVGVVTALMGAPFLVALLRGRTAKA